MCGRLRLTYSYQPHTTSALIYLSLCISQLCGSPSSILWRHKPAWRIGTRCMQLQRDMLQIVDQWDWKLHTSHIFIGQVLDQWRAQTWLVKFESKVSVKLVWLSGILRWNRRHFWSTQIFLEISESFPENELDACEWTASSKAQIPGRQQPLWTVLSERAFWETLNWFNIVPHHEKDN